MRRIILLLFALTLYCCDAALPNVRVSLTGLSESVQSGVRLDRIQPSVDVLPKIGEPVRPDVVARPSKALLDEAITAAEKTSLKFDAFERTQLSKGIDTNDTNTPMFGPHLLTNDEALQIGKLGDIFLDAASTTIKRLGVAPTMARESLKTIKLPVIGTHRCPFSRKIKCDRNYPYRLPDGSCNNLDKPYWGKSNTPFERFIPAFYDDGIQSPRQLSAASGGPLPGARKISVTVHEASTSAHQMNDVNHFTMEFGQLVSHDIQRNALSKGYLGSNLNCCKFPNRRNCFPIPIDVNDPHFSQFKRTCMNMVRALPTPNLDCKFGQREQLNQNTHYLDGSHIYGSDSRTMNNLRLKIGGKLKSTNNDLLPQDTHNNAACILTNSQNKCFLAGDVRLNQQPMLISQHTIWMKEHNRVAGRLAIENPHWNDEKLFQEARKIVIAEFQHITYNEYLPEILGSQHMSGFDLNPKASGYFTGYNKLVKPQIRNVFAAAAFRFGHSMVRDKVSYRNGHTTFAEYLHHVFLRPDLIYSPSAGVERITRGLYEVPSQKVDRLFTTELTKHLFERQPGFGGDLAAINIQRGRDHGMANYNTWRMACGLKPAFSFNPGTPGGLLNHNADAALALSQAYQHPDDIDVFTGGVSETPVPGGKVGPLFACIIGLQFKALKYGDRHFYENNNANVRFTPQQLAEIRKTTMARVICDNTDTNIIDRLPTDVFRKRSLGNPNKMCNSFVKFDFQFWKDCVNGGWSAWRPVNSFFPCWERRTCTNPRPQKGCGKPCVGLSTRTRKNCGGIGIDPISPPRITLPPRFTIRPILDPVRLPELPRVPNLNLQ